MKRFCLVCGKELTGGQKILCSPECRLKYYETPRVICCQKCGRIITVTGKRNVCWECMLSHWRQYSNSTSAVKKRREKYRAYNKLREEGIKKAEAEKPKPKYSIDDYVCEIGKKFFVLRAPRKVTLTEEQKQIRREILLRNRKMQHKKTGEANKPDAET